MWDEVDLVPGRGRRGSRAGIRELVELVLLLAAALLAGILPFVG